MQKYNPSISLFFDTRIEKQNGKYPVKISVYCKPIKKRYSTKIDLTKDEWQAIHSDKLKDKNLKEVRIKLNALTTKAQNVITNLVPFSFIQFEEAFYENATNLNSLKLSVLFERYISKHEKRGSVGTAISYQTSINSFENYKKNLSIYDITPQFLQDYEFAMLEQGKSPSTVGIYIRQLRAVYNEAISRNLVDKGSYPFGKNKYVIPVSRNIKKALSADDLRLILDHKPITIDQQKALDFWIFSYLSNGMNFCDIAQLKKENINDDFIYYIRAKTRNTKKGNEQQIKVPFHSKAKEIMLKWKSRDLSASYIFPILEDCLSPIQIKYRIQDFIKRNNQGMESIRKDLGITQKCNTYSCRHSFATVLKRKNVSTEFISESLGHSSLLTTSSYLASFEDKIKIEYSNLLTSF